MRVQRSNIQFCQVPYLETQRVCTQKIYTLSNTCNIFGFVISYLNCDLNAVNYLQKLKKFSKCIQMKFSRPLNDDETEEFDQL